MPNQAGSGGGKTLVLFGGGGDLALRMLFPSLCFLESDGLLPSGLTILATGRHQRSSESFREEVAKAIEARSGGDFDAAACERLLKRVGYMAADARDPASLHELACRVEQIGGGGDITYYLATSPSLYGLICEGLKAAGQTGPGTRVVLEKPIGKDLASSRAINDAVAAAFSEDRVFRIDHYLGKETVQNLIALRFANTLFEPLWNNLTIDHVQITVGETGGVGDRWGYYDEYGAMGDMVQNHMMQLLCFVAMEPPSDLEPDSVRNEKVKVLRSLRPIGRAEVLTDLVRGQYTRGVSEGEVAKAYEEERGEPSPTETFVALKAWIDNWRWAGVPFFLRTGKRLPSRSTEIFIQFKPVPHSIFTGESKADLVANQLVIRLQPDEDIVLRLMNKAPGLSTEGMRLESLPLSLFLGQAARPGQKPPRRRIAYERLLLDAMNGASTLFVRRDEVEKAWEWVDGINDAWRRSGQNPKPYAAGTWGPAGAFALIEREGRQWHE
jgi:glucose-6-phosphate 1-dehydrogenase